MHKISLILSTAALSLQNAGARAATNDLGLTIAAPHPTMMAGLALIGMAFLVLMARTPLSKPPEKPAKWPDFLSAWPPQRTAFALAAMIAVSGSLGMA